MFYKKEGPSKNILIQYLADNQLEMVKDSTDAYSMLAKVRERYERKSMTRNTERTIHIQILKSPVHLFLILPMKIIYLLQAMILYTYTDPCCESVRSL